MNICTSNIQTDTIIFQNYYLIWEYDCHSWNFPSQIVQKMIFFLISQWILLGKILNFHRILTNLFVTRIIKIIYWCAVVAKNQQKIYDREFSIVKCEGLMYEIWILLLLSNVPPLTKEHQLKMNKYVIVRNFIAFDNCNMYINVPHRKYGIMR